MVYYCLFTFVLSILLLIFISTSLGDNLNRTINQKQGYKIFDFVYGYTLPLYSQIKYLNNINMIENNESVVNVVSGQTFMLKLQEKVSTGHRWQPIYDSNYFEKISEDYMTDSSIPGSSTTHLFSFKALKTGEQSIKMIYKRDFEKTIANEKVFLIKITQ